MKEKKMSISADLISAISREIIGLSPEALDAEAIAESLSAYVQEIARLRELDLREIDLPLTFSLEGEVK